MEVKRLPLEGLNNTRDLGDLLAAGEPRIARGRLLRSGALWSASARDLSVLREECGVHTVVDLRTQVEAENQPDPALPGCVTLYLPVLDDSFFGIARDSYSVEAWFNMFLTSGEAPADVFAAMYRRIVFSERSIGLWRRFFVCLLQNERGAVLWHCSAGKDRAGLAAVLLLSALGFSEQAAIFDYLQTGTFTADEIEAVKAMATQRTDDPRMLEATDVLMGVRPVYITGIFDEMRERFGGVNGFFTKTGILSDAETGRLKELYLK